MNFAEYCRKNGLPFDMGELLDEMAQYKPEKTGLPIDVWLDNEGRPLQHWHRLKFSPQNGTTRSNQFPAITLSLEPEIPKDHRHDIRTKTKDINAIKTFMAQAEKCRLELVASGIKKSNEGLTTAEFETLFTQNKNGEPLTLMKKHSDV